MSRDHFLQGFLNPKSVAFYGANNKGGSLAAIQIMNLIKALLLLYLIPKWFLKFLESVEKRV
jgi:hypothetical protein